MNDKYNSYHSSLSRNYSMVISLFSCSALAFICLHDEARHATFRAANNII